MWVVQGKLFKDNERQNVLVLVHCNNEEQCKHLIQHYLQVNQIRLSYQFLPLALDVYIRRHGEVLGLADQESLLSDDNPVILFDPNDYKVPVALTPCLEKNIFNIRRYDTEGHSVLHTGVPANISSLLWDDSVNNNCYAIIHAVKSFWFPSDFKDENIQSACLYQGDMAENYETSAPYLLTLPKHHSLVTKLFSEEPSNREDGFNHWGKKPGIFFRSQASFDELLTHFRRFVYMRTYDDRLLYFRFYDPIVLKNYLDNINRYPNKVSTFFGRGLISAFSVGFGDHFIDYTPTIDLSEVGPAPNQFDKLEMSIFIKQHDEKILANVHKSIISDFPDFNKYYSHDEVKNVVDKSFELAKKNNIKESVCASFLALFSLFFNQPFEDIDAEGILTNILNSDKAEHAKIYDIKKRITQLEGEGSITNCIGVDYG